MRLSIVRLTICFPSCHMFMYVAHDVSWVINPCVFTKKSIDLDYLRAQTIPNACYSSIDVTSLFDIALH